MSLRLRPLLALAFATAMFAACGDERGEPTGSTCPTGSTLTYTSFAAPFMEKYCTRCHSSTRSGKDRHGAPAFHDFDTEAGILAVAEHIDENAAAGPDASNDVMPPSSPRPTEEERKQLGEWLACATR